MDKCKTRLGYNVVPPPYTDNFMPPKSDLVYPSLDDFTDVNESISESVVEKPTIETNKPKTARKENGSPIIEDWVSHSDEENVPKVKTVEMFNKPSFAKINDMFSSTILVLLLNTLNALLLVEYPRKNPSSAFPLNLPRLKAQLKQGESINVQDLETNLYWEFGKFTSRDGESLESYYSRFYKMMNELVRNQCHVTNHQVNVQFLLQLQTREWQRFVTLVKQSQELKTVSYHKLYDILKQHQNEVNEIRTERLARTANPLALVAQQQPVYHHQNHPTQNTQYSSTRSQQSTRNRGKAIVTSSAPTYDPEPATVTEDEEMSKEKEIDKLMALISLSFKKIYKPTNNNLRTSSNTSRANQDNSPRINRETGYDNQRAVNVAGARENVGTPVVQKSGIQCYNCKEYGHVSRECQKPKLVKDAAYHKERMLLCKQEKAGVQLNVEQANCKDDTDDESDDQELEAHYMYMAQIHEVTPDSVDNSRPIFDDEPMHKVQNYDNYNVFAMENAHPEQPKSSNDIYLTEQCDTNITIDSSDICYDRAQDDQDKTDDLDQERDLLASLIQKLKCEIEDFKTKNKSLESSNNHFKEANNELSKTNQLMFKDLKKFQAELDKYNDVNYASKVEIDCAKAKGDLMSYKIDFEKSSNAYTQQINDLNQTISDMKKELCAHQETISIMSQAKEAQIKLYKTREDKELDKVIALENKVKVLNDIVYKTGQSVQTMNMLNRNCKTSFAKPEFLKKAQRANPRLYDIGCYNDNLALMLAPDSDETIRLEKERRSKLSDLIRPFDYAQLNNLYDWFVPQREKSAEQHYFPKTSKMCHTSSNKEFSKESFRKQPTLLEKRIDESIPWDKKCQSSKELFKIKKCVGTIFDGVERCKQTIAKRTYFGNIDPFIQNTIEGNFGPQISKLNADLERFHLCLKEEMVADLKYVNSLEDEVDNLKSQMETQRTQFLNEIDRLSRIFLLLHHMKRYLEYYRLDEFTDFAIFFAKKVFLKGEYSNTSVSRPQLKSNHLEDRVMSNNSQGRSKKTKMPMDMPLSTREHKRTVNQSVATPLKRTVASDSTNQKPKHITRKLYKHVSKTCSWWYPKFTPSGYKWKPKSQIGNVNTNVNMPLGNASRTANILEPMTPKCSTMLNTPLSSNSFAARRDNPIHRRLWVLKAHDRKSQASN
ncbi:integrase, catalytic region, zinc finger, CCHC-type containing protein [Tanacetum coccineum]|uniref:Integrase, catalytic region, zinc finger, CCHC-type containing protein n=1 Tax=Tanacetum coccineum TaxID=301880 RepID=A0ABQ5H977_9ASTR